MSSNLNIQLKTLIGAVKRIKKDIDAYNEEKQLTKADYVSKI